MSTGIEFAATRPSTTIAMATTLMA